jgi:hypothetical protein
MRYCRRFLAGIPHLRVDSPRVPHPSATPFLRRAFDLHVLGTPPAFILSQDQTRHPILYRISPLPMIDIACEVAIMAKLQKHGNCSQITVCFSSQP